MENNLFNQEENRKIQVAYNKMHVHTSAFDNFDEFYSYFMDIKDKSTEDKELIKWLLKVLFLKLKEDKKSDWDILLEKVDEKKKQELLTWLKTNLDRIQE